jgi:transposase-like protein
VPHPPAGGDEPALTRPPARASAGGYREILGLWAGDGGEGAKYGRTVLTEIRTRGVKDVLMLVCDGLSALPDAAASAGTTAGKRPQRVRRPLRRHRD